MNIPAEHQLQNLSAELGALLKAAGLMLATAESCTGGWVAKEITAVAGSSHWFDRGFVTYTNQAKQDMLGVTAQTLEQNGAVSELTVREMVAGALRHSQAGVSLAISGIAGPGGATVYKPVGTVCFAWSVEGQTWSMTHHFDGDREQVRAQAVAHALQELIRYFHG